MIKKNRWPLHDMIKLCVQDVQVSLCVYLLLMPFQAALCLSVTSLILLVSSVEYSCKRWLDSSLKAATGAWPRPRSWRNACKTINMEALGSSWHWNRDRWDSSTLRHCEQPSWHYYLFACTVFFVTFWLGIYFNLTKFSARKLMTYYLNVIKKIN